MNQSLEIGICYLFTEENSKVLTDFLRDRKISQSLPSTPHVSLFQMCVDFERYPDVLKKVREIFAQKPPLLFDVKGVTGRYGNTIIDLEDPSGCFERDVIQAIDALAPLRSQKHLQQVTDAKDLTRDQKERVSRYGIYWNVPPLKIKPHLTLLYGQELPLGDFPLSRIEGKSVAIGKIGYQGNLIEMMEVVSTRTSTLSLPFLF